MKVLTAKIKELKSIAGESINMLECKKALEEAEGDIDAAVQILIKNGCNIKLKRETFLDKIEPRVSYKLSTLITTMVSIFNERGNSLEPSAISFCLYTKGHQKLANGDTICYVDESLTVNDEDKELYPDFVINEGLRLFYHGDQFEDVIYNALHQKSDISVDKIIEALNYYSQRDSFLDFT